MSETPTGLAQMQRSHIVLWVPSGALAAFLVGYLPLSWSVLGELVLCVLSLLMAMCVLVMDLLKDIWVCYGLYVLFRTTYMLLITMAT